MNKINILTWNTNNNKTDEFYSLLNEMLDFYKIDILILQEGSGINFEFKNYQEILNPNKGTKWVRIFYYKKRIPSIYYSNIKSIDFSDFTDAKKESNKLFFIEFKIDEKYTFTFCGVHFYSKTGRTEIEQNNYNRYIPECITDYEKERRHDKTILVGDFNYNPFETTMNNPSFLNANSSKMIIKQLQVRKSGNRNYKFFYNPMWNKLGDNENISGTYYYKKAEKDGGLFFWNILDGVLLRPSMMETIELDTLKIISEFNGNNLVREDKEKKQSFILEKYSDHLPVTFTLNLKKITK